MQRSDGVSVVLLLGLSVLLWLPRLQGPIDYRYDGAVYFILGTSLSEGKGYRLLNEPGEIPAVQYPPGLPAFVALHQWIMGTHNPLTVGHALRLSFFVIFSIYLIAVYSIARQFLQPVLALAVGVITAINSNCFFVSDFLFADIPFSLTVIVFVLLNRQSQKPLYFFLTSLAAIAANLLRTAGIGLLAAWILESVCEKNWKQTVLRTSVSLLPVVAWQGCIAWVTSGDEFKNPCYAYQRAPYVYYNVTYLENLLLDQPFRPEEGKTTRKDLWNRFWLNLVAMPESLGEGIASENRYFLALMQERFLFFLGLKGLANAPVAHIPLVMVGCLVIGGTVLLLIRREWLISIFAAVTVTLICLTPWPDQMGRYTVPLIPFFVIGLFLLLIAVNQFCRDRFSGVAKKIGFIFSILIVSLILIMEVYTVQRTFRELFMTSARLFWYDETWTSYEESLDWLKDKVKSGEIIATWAPHWAYLRTGHKAVMPPMEIDSAKAQQLLDTVPAKYLILDEIDFQELVPHYSRPIITHFPEKWQRIYVSPSRKTEIFERKNPEKDGHAG